MDQKASIHKLNMMMWSGHIKRSAVIITSKQVKLVIKQTKASDDGIYRMKIQGSETAICEVNCITRSKSIK